MKVKRITVAGMPMFDVINSKGRKATRTFLSKSAALRYIKSGGKK